MPKEGFPQNYWLVDSVCGELAFLEKCFERIPTDDGVVFGGNYVNWGPSPLECVDFLIELAKNRPPERLIFTLGYQERALLLFAGIEKETESFKRKWISPYLGLPTTIAAYGVDPWPILFSSFPSDELREKMRSRGHLKFFSECTSLEKLSWHDVEPVIPAQGFPESLRLLKKNGSLWDEEFVYSFSKKYFAELTKFVARGMSEAQESLGS